MEFILIDDSAFDLFTQEKLLLKSGLAHAVKAFSSAQSAMDFLENQTEHFPETIILLDIQMPGLNGFEFTRQYAHLPESLRRRIRIYMISSTVDTDDIARVRSNPYVMHLLSKPLEIPVLRALLGQ
ncbi:MULTISPECIES: response regulator [Dyadobacter]|jgi:CheY-like chemotaxis protein|uniref:Response regulator n=1 Tax=Dyadobacter chenhuakuii TaxID=2909339 RepID=A0A9X1TZA0_9BACT|nr:MULTISPECIES: response regulator [Dyadobacter]MCE7070255.1 response regulator [Dyadobacter sp. CY327]MCF2492554.1 response regulator [Dyadobacter chenhuakuii]MCF2497036.1 response regulator [Dyadobacter chenhuakuii]MCF2520429.1 response regulator [Dyadobacter sp. CY351]USJ33151.1 response regulator [Dyadobacter chenhuakuii]